MSLLILFGSNYKNNGYEFHAFFILKNNIMETKKKQVFNGQELAMLFQAFSKRIFSRPQKGDIYSKSNYSDDNSCTFYISLSYYDTLLKEFQNAYVQGKFAHSNANITWVNLMNKLIDASNVVDFEEENNLEDYYESVNSFWF